MQYDSPFKRGGLLFSLLLAGLFSFCLAATVPAQVRIPAAALSGPQDLQRILTEGQQLEQQQRWGEALTRYEEALRDFPGQPDLQQRLTLARAHYDLARRYRDQSFLSAIQRMDDRRALDIYSEVLLKIQAHYVHEPQWQQLVQRGTTQLSVALTDPLFVQRHLSAATAGQLAGLNEELHQLLDARVPRSRVEARDEVALAARYASRRLGLSPPAVIMEYTCGALGALDLYSSYLTGDQLDDLMSQIEGNFVGLGIELKADQGSLLIVSVIAGGPADRAGIHSGDRIVKVEGRPTAEMSTNAAADMLKGPEGSSVQLTIVSADETTRTLQLRRERVEVPSVEEAKILDPQFGIAYLKLTSFQKTTVRDFDAALWSLHYQGMKSLIVDVRGNPGGLLTAAVEVADKFIPAGTIVSTRGRSPREDFDYKAHHAGTWRVPLIVLIDRDSASAAEIFAAAIRDHRRGTVVGQRSFGKGSVQGIFPLNVIDGGVRLTTAKFYSPNGVAISHRGVDPDIVVRTVARPAAGAAGDVSQTADTTLQAGLQVARQQLSQR